MKKILIIAILFALTVSVYGDSGFRKATTATGGGKISVKEVDGSPSGSNIDILKVNNGSLTISDNVATINITAVAASSADSISRDDGIIDGDSLMTKSRTDTVTGAKIFLGDVELPLNCVTSDQIATNAVGSLEIAGSAVKESEINWAEVTIDSVTSRVKASRIDSLFDTITLGSDPRNVDGKINFVDADGATNEITSDGDSINVTGAANGFKLREVPLIAHHNGIGATQSDVKGIILRNNTAAAAGAQQYSPSLVWSGYGWKTNATPGSQLVKFMSQIVPVQGTANPTGYLGFYSSINGAAYSATPNLQIYDTGNTVVNHPGTGSLTVNDQYYSYIIGGANGYATKSDRFQVSMSASLATLYTNSGMFLDVGGTKYLYLTGGNLNVGHSTIVDQQSIDLIVNNDADSDADITNEALTISLTANATPTLATWGFTSTQSAGYTFDKAMSITTPSAGSQVGLTVQNKKSSGTLALFGNDAAGSTTASDSVSYFDSRAYLNTPGVKFVSLDGDTNSWRAKGDGTLNAYASSGIGLFTRKATRSTVFTIGNDASGVDSSITIGPTGNVGIKGAPSTNALEVNGVIYNNSYAAIGSVILSSSNIYSGSTQNGYISLTSSGGVGAYTGTSEAGENIFLDILDRTGVDNQVRIGDTGNSGEYCTIDSVGRLAVGLNTTNTIYDLDVDGGIRGSDTLRVGNYSTYTYIVPGGDPVKSSDASLKTNFVPIDSILHPWELFGKAEGLEIFQFKYDSAKVYQKARFDSTVYSWWNEKPADSLSLGQKDSVSAELAKRKVEIKKNWEAEQKEFASKVSKPIHTGPTEAGWNSLMYSDKYRKGINSGEVTWVQWRVIQKLIAEVKRQDGLIKDLETRVSKLDGK